MITINLVQVNLRGRRVMIGATDQDRFNLLNLRIMTIEWDRNQVTIKRLRRKYKVFFAFHVLHWNVKPDWNTDHMIECLGSTNYDRFMSRWINLYNAIVEYTALAA